MATRINKMISHHLFWGPQSSNEEALLSIKSALIWSTTCTYQKVKKIFQKWMMCQADALAERNQTKAKVVLTN